MGVRGRIVEVLYLVLPVVDRLLQALVPPRPDRACFLSIPDHTDNAYHAYRHLVRTRRGLELVWLVGDPGSAATVERRFAELVEGLPDHGHRLRVVPRHSLRGYLAHLRSRWVFHSHGAYAFSRSAVRRDVVSLWHGMPLKAIGRLNPGASRKQAFGSLHLATSPAFRYVIACAFGVPADRVAITGLPRCDPLRLPEARTLHPAEVRTRLGVPDGDRLVVWLPTFRVRDDEAHVHVATRLDAHGGGRRSFLDDLPDWVLPSVAEASRTHGCRVVVKPHPLDVLNRRPPVLDGTGVQFLTDPAFLATEVPLYDLLAAADALVSDVSSVIVDFLVTDRPVGLVGFDPATYDRQLVLPMEVLASSGRCHALDRPEDVDDLLRQVREGRAAGTDDDLLTFLHDDLPGSSAERVLAEVGL